MTQRQAAELVGVSQPAVSQQLKNSPELNDMHPEALLDAAAPVLKALAVDYGYTRLAAFGSVARRQARQTSDIDLLVEAPPGTTPFAFLEFKHVLEHVLDRKIDLVSYGALQPIRDDDIRREAVLL